MLKPPKVPESAPPQLKPRPILFRVLCAVFAVWMLALLVMYFWTVYPLRHPANHLETGAATLPN
jgi:hypothetical protein